LAGSNPYSYIYHNFIWGVFALRGLGKPQIKQRKKTENKIKNFLKRRRVVNVNEIIEGTKTDPTAVIGAIRRLVRDRKLIQHKHKNRKLVGLPTPMNRYFVKRLKKEEEKKRRSQAQIDILVEKAAGKRYSKLKETYKKSKERLDRIDRDEFLSSEINKLQDQMREVLEVDTDKWAELYTKREKLFKEYMEIM